MRQTKPLYMAAALSAAMLATFAVSAPTIAAQDGGAPDEFAGMRTLKREVLVRAVLDRNPTIEAARAAWRAAEARPAQAGAFEDPMLSYALAPGSIGSSDVRYGQVIDFSQRLPFPGKRGLRAAVEAAEARAEHGGYRAVQLDTALIASLLYDDYWTVERALEVNAEHVALLAELMESAKSHYATGHASQYALVRVEVEQAHVEHGRVVLRTERDVIVARLNALLHRKASEKLPPPARALIAAELVEIGRDEVLETALAARPEVVAAEARVEGAESAVSLARREYFPDFAVGVSYNTMWNEPEHRTMAGLSINVPLQLGRRRAALDEAEADLLRRRSERAALTDRVASEIETARRRLSEAEHVVMLFRDRILPAAHDRVSSVRAAFETGEVGFDSLIDAERDLRNDDLGYQVAMAGRSRRRAELDRALGDMPVLQGEEVIR